ncbi:MAG: family 20 glycosylhydrolase [Bacteroidota bacterium]
MLASCTTPPSSKTPKGQTAIIPKPQQMSIQGDSFLLQSTTKIQLAEAGADWGKVADYLNEKLAASTSEQKLEVVQGPSAKGALNIISDATIAGDAYRLKVDSEQIELAAGTPQGAFYGLQSLLQLMPVGLYGTYEYETINFKIPGVLIEDQPRFPYRGMHLDVCRHFYDVDAVKRYIDILALHKFNYFHWHLTEDQGWRMEIKQYPKLTEVGGFRKETLVGHYNDQPHQFDGKRYGGFYTQEQVKEVIEYAADRFITIIPEIELPGHAQAAIAAYPELGCTGQQLEVLTKWGVSDNVYCPSEETFAFLQNVLNEVMDLFPGKYIHIGGDECPKTQWKESEFCQQLIKKEGLKDEYELQSYFIRRIEKMINARGKQLIGWDEILEGGLAPNATVMSWRGMEGGIAAATQGHDVVMSPTSHCYFDYYQSEHEEEPLAIGGFLPLEKVYGFEPVPEELPEDKQHHILGLQANVWTEYIPDVEKLDYMTYPRAMAIAEVGWTDKEQRSFDDFVQRLDVHFQRLTAYGINAAASVYDLNVDCETKPGELVVKLSANVPNMQIRYTLDGSSPTPTSTLYEGPISVGANSQLRAAGFVDGAQRGRVAARDIELHKGVGRLLRLNHAPADRYAAGGHSAIFNGIRGSSERYGDKEWLGFAGKDMNALLVFDQKTEVKGVKMRFFKGEGQWIYLPKRVTIACSNDAKGKDFYNATVFTDINTETKVAEIDIPLDLKQGVEAMNIIAENFGTIPDGLQGGGHSAWLFVDEVEIY